MHVGCWLWPKSHCYSTITISAVLKMRDGPYLKSYVKIKYFKQKIYFLTYYFQKLCHSRICGHNIQSHNKFRFGFASIRRCWDFVLSGHDTGCFGCYKRDSSVSVTQMPVRKPAVGNLTLHYTHYISVTHVCSSALGGGIRGLRLKRIR